MTSGNEELLVILKNSGDDEAVLDLKILEEEFEGKELEMAVRRRAKGEPLAYILGYRHFYKECYKVCSGVLIPRADTEMVVESALKFLGIDDMATGDLLKIPDYDKELTDIRFADFCTGTGCIGISVAKGGKVSGYLIDISDTAIDTASYNVESQAIRPEFINVMKYDVTCNAPDIGELDFIVSNPPYITNEEMNTLDKGVKDYEPDLALRAGDDGLDFYHPIIESAKKLLRDGGALMVEHGYGQGDSVREIFESAGLKKCMTIRDYGGNDRVTLGIK